MNWEAIGAIGQMIGALAVFASLVFVGLQIRQSDRSKAILRLPPLRTSLSRLVGEAPESGDFRIFARFKPL